MKLKNGYYSAIYLLKTGKILKKEKLHNITEVQFFQRNNNVVLCGIKHILEILKKEAHDYPSLRIKALLEGSIINADEPVLTITGELWKFIHLEGIIDGILVRESSIATNARNLLSVINGKELIYMNDRSDYYFTQQWDGYAAYIGGVRSFVTNAQIELLPNKKDVKLVGTVPHALIQNFHGNIVDAMKAYANNILERKLVALVDYNNNVVSDALKVAQEFGKRLFAIRVDTSMELIDKSLEAYKSKYSAEKLKGVNTLLIKNLRKILDEANYQHIKIIASSGLNVDRIGVLEKENCPVDIYGVGKFFSNINLNFTCDAVMIDSKKEAKVGRHKIENKKLKLIK